MFGQRGFGAHMWGFGMSHNKRSTFVDEAAHDAYVEHVRLCPKRHDPRGKAFGGCAEVPDHWFATDSAEEAE